ncbi:hypothetical protein [Caloramator sp. ALD01]|uniref:DUF7922 domain-containing protein n=1 Tax=Caloramator sp. ALD01 TaxID=1031288 RepID=UPI00041DC9AF|nr:hypothetical protein [Caloramator sp. ALD01]
MSAKKSYSRYFIILQEEDKGFGIAIDKQPTGYTKIENKNGKCKITVYVQNLVKEKGPYVCYLIDTTKNPLYTARLGEVPVDDTGRGEIWWEYKEDNVADTGLNVDKFNVSTIVVEAEQTNFPLVGYVGKERASFKDRFVVKKRTVEEPKEEVKVEVEVKDEVVEKEAEKFIEYENEIKKEVMKLEEVKEDKKDEEDTIYDEAAQVELIRNEELKIKKQQKHANYFEEILRDFEEVDGITEEYSNCRWWKVKLDYDIKLKDNKYYPYYCAIYHIKMAYPYINYLKYCKNTGYYYFGIKYDKDGEVKYLLYGIEGENDVKSQPYSGMTGFIKWIKVKDKGMWVMTYNPYNGCIMIPKPKDK